MPCAFLISISSAWCRKILTTAATSSIQDTSAKPCIPPTGVIFANPSTRVALLLRFRRHAASSTFLRSSSISPGCRHARQLLLNRLHLLAQQVLALILLTCSSPVREFSSEAPHFQLFREFTNQRFKALPHASQFRAIPGALTLRERSVPRDKIGKPARIIYCAATACSRRKLR